MNNQFVTQTANFISAKNPGVDPRTGLYSISVALGTLTGNNGMGPHFPLTFTYSPLNILDIGAGLGFSIPIALYNTHTKILSLAGGETHPVHESGEQVNLRQQKLKALLFTKNNEGYVVTHKNGDKEFLTGEQYAAWLKVPLILENAAGHRLYLQWEMVKYDTPRLQAVTDDMGATLLTLTYSENHVYLDVWPNSPDAYQVNFIFDGNHLVKIENTSDPAMPLIWTLQYSNVGAWGTWLTGLTLPGGLSESVTYRTDGFAHRFPDAAHLPALPYVTRIIVLTTPEALPQQTDYTWSMQNFLGYNSSQPWDATQDSLYGPLTDYTYSSTEVFSRNNLLVTVSRVYNCYHLLIEEKTVCDQHQHIQTIDYHARPGKSFEEQPAFFLLPKCRTESWVSDAGRRDDVFRTTFDDYGNPTYQVLPDGSTCSWQYYPSQGEVDACPAEPNGFVRFLRQITSTPATVDIQPFTDVNEQICNYTWIALLSLRAGNLIMKHQETYLSGPRILKQITYGYDTSSIWRGRLASRSSTNWANGEPAGNVSEEFTVEQDGQELHYTHTVISDDNLSLTEHHYYSRWSHRPLSYKNAQGLNTLTTWDALGRQKTKTLNAGTLYENTSYTEYGFSNQNGASFCITQKDALGNQTRDHISTQGHVLSQQFCLADQHGAWYTHSQSVYDEFNRLIKCTTRDENNANPSTEYSLETTLEYDAWGQLYRTTSNDGVVTISTFNPITLQQISYVTDVNGSLNSARKITHLNRNHQPMSVEYVDAQGKRMSFRSFVYDGLYRLRGMTESVTDSTSQTTTYTPDDYGRVLETILPDGTQITRAFATFSSGNLLTAITVDGVLYGTQKFDGLGRMTESVSGGRRHQYNYRASTSVHPEIIITPDNHTITRDFIHELGQALSQVMAENIIQKFTYNPITGALLECSEGNNRQVYTYDASGRVSSMMDYRGDQQVQYREYNYTTLGRLVQETDILKEISIVLERDGTGKLIRKDSGNIITTLSYDSLGRIIGYSLQDDQDNTGTTLLTLDEMGREVERAFTAPGLCTRQKLRWQQNSRIFFAQDKCATETYSYDARNRLIHYVCDAAYSANFPHDEFGRPFKEQIFNWDELNNVKKVTTLYDEIGDSGKSVAYYQYNNKVDPTQLTDIRYSHTDPLRINKDRSLSYDLSGRMLDDGHELKFQWDALGRLQYASVCGYAPGSYEYNAFNQMVSLPDKNIQNIYRMYSGPTLREVQNSENNVRFIHVCGKILATVSENDVGLYSTDIKGSVTSMSKGKHSDFDRRFTPFGGSGGDMSPIPQDPSLISFCGEATDELTGLYHLGNGYRPYSSALMRFISPDNMSPFGGGGINPYAYCSGDPINLCDPTGHFNVGKFFTWLGIGIGALGLAVTGIGLVADIIAGASLATIAVTAALVTTDAASLGTGIASLTVHNKKTAENLGWASFATGLPGLVYGGVKMVPSLIKGAKSLYSASQQLARIREVGLSGRGAIEAMKRTITLGLDESILTQMRQNIAEVNSHAFFVHGSTSDSFEGVLKFRALLSMEDMDRTPWFHGVGTLKSGERGYTISGLSNGAYISKGVSLNSGYNYTNSLIYSTLYGSDDSYPVLYGIGGNGFSLDDLNPEILNHPVTLGSISLDHISAIWVPLRHYHQAYNMFLSGAPSLAKRIRAYPDIL